MLSSKLDIIIDDENEIITINGILYTYGVFRAWASGGLPVGSVFEIVERDGCRIDLNHRKDIEAVNVGYLMDDLTKGEQEG